MVARILRNGPGAQGRAAAGKRGGAWRSGAAVRGGHAASIVGAATGVLNFVGYLGDPDDTEEASPSFWQKEVVDAYASRPITRYYVDSGCIDGPARQSYGLQDLLRDASRRAFDAVAVVRFAPIIPLSLEALAHLIDAAIEVHECASGNVYANPSVVDALGQVFGYG